MSEVGGGIAGGSGEGGEEVTNKPAARPKVLHDLMPKKIPHILNENYVPSTPVDNQSDRPDLVIPDSQDGTGETDNAGKPNFDLRFQYELSSQEILPTHVKEQLKTDLDEFDFTQPSSPVFGTTYTQQMREKCERRVVVDKLVQEEIDAHIAKMHLQDSRNTPKEIKVRLSNREQIRGEIDKIVQSSDRKVRILEQVDGEFVTFRCVRDLKRANKRKKQAETATLKKKAKPYQHMDRLVSRYRKDAYYHKAESSSKALQQMAVASVRGLEKVYEIYVPTIATLTFNNKEVYPVYGDELHRRFQWPEFMSITNVCKMLKRDTRKPVDLQVVKERFNVDDEAEGRKKYRHRISTFSVLTEAEAVKMAYDYKMILDEQDLPTPTGEELTIGDLLQTYIDHYEEHVPFDRLTHGAGPALLSLTVYHLLEWISGQGNLILDPEAPQRETTGFQDWGDRLAGAIEVEEDKSSTAYAKKRKPRKGPPREQGHGSDQADDKSSYGDEDEMRDFVPEGGGRGQRKAAVSARGKIIETYDMTHDEDDEEMSDDEDCRLIEDPNSSKDMDHEERQQSILKLRKTSNKILQQLEMSAKDIGKLNKQQTKIKHAIQTITDVDNASKASSGGNNSRDSSFEEGVTDSQLLRAEAEAVDKDREIEALKLEAELMRSRLEQADPYAYALTRKNLMDLRCKDLLSAFLKFKNKGEQYRPQLENAETALDKVCQPVIGPNEYMYQCAAGTVDKLKSFVTRGIITPNIVFNRKTFEKTGLDGVTKEKVIYVFQALEIKAEGAQDRLEAQDVTLMDFETGDGTLPKDFEEKLATIKKEEKEGVVDKDKDKPKDDDKKPVEVTSVDNEPDGKQKVDSSAVKPSTDSTETEPQEPVEEKMEVEGESAKFPQESSAFAEAMDTAEEASRKQGRKGHASAARTRPSPVSRQHSVTAAEVNLCTDAVGTGTLCLKPPHSVPSAEFSDGDLKEAGIGINPAVTKKRTKKDSHAAPTVVTTRSTRSSVPK